MIDQPGLNANFDTIGLEEIISTVTVELVNYGGTTPPQTYDVLVEDFHSGCLRQDVPAAMNRPKL